MAQSLLLGLLLLQRSWALVRKRTAVVVDSSSAIHRASEIAEVNDVVYHLHIPKVGGISFGTDEDSILRKHGLKQESKEACFDWYRGNPDILGASLLLREPRKHVVSLYDFCLSGAAAEYIQATRQPFQAPLPAKLETWVKEWRILQESGWHANATPDWHRVSNSSTEDEIRRGRIKAWSKPPFSAEQVFLDEKNWPELDGGGTIWHFVNVPFQCYSPINFQTQRLSCSRPMEFPETPNVEQALRNLDSALFVGILEHYQASVCLLQTKLGELPPYCDCRQRHQWKAFPFKELNVNESPRTNFTSVTQDTLQEIDKLTAADRQVYQAGLRRFAREVAEAEAKFSTKLLCNVTLPL